MCANPFPGDRWTAVALSHWRNRMRIRYAAAVLGAAVLVSGIAFGQDNRVLEQDLASRYIGRSFDNAQPYLNREVWYDQDGNITENPTPVCESIYGVLAVKRIKVRGNEVDVEVTRSGKRQPPRFVDPPWPSYASRDVTLRFKAPGGWTGD